MAKVEKRKGSRAASLFTYLLAIVVIMGVSTANGQTTGSISGSVYESGCTNTITGVTIFVFQDYETLYRTTSDGSGQFTVDGVPEGDYYIYVAPGEDQNYIAEYYNNIIFTIDAELDTVHVAAGEDTDLDDICLDEGATISGTVYETGSPETVIAGARVSALDYDTWYSEYVFTDDDGEYAIMGLPVGDFYLSVDPVGQNYVKEHYENAYFSSDATPVTVSAAGESIDIDFELDPGGSISGRVTNSNNEGLADIWVMAYSGDCYFWNYLDVVLTDEDGYYTHTGLPAGNIYLAARPFDQNYFAEWYNDAAYCDDAEPIAVVAGEDTGDINFQLEMSGVISGHVYESDGTTPIANSQVVVLSFPCDDPGDPDAIMYRIYTDSSGEYTITGLLEGEFYVLAYGTTAETDEMAEHIRNWYNDAFSCEEAEAVSVVLGTEAEDIDFRLYSYTDSDNDNMPDQWEYVYFGDLSNDGFGDSDNDGVSDVDEYTYGTLPTDISSDDETDENIDGDDGNDGGGGGCFISDLF